jgi:hypothetical protein
MSTRWLKRVFYGQDAEGQAKVSRFSKRKQKEEKMISAAVFGDADKAKPKKHKPSEQVSKFLPSFFRSVS